MDHKQISDFVIIFKSGRQSLILAAQMLFWRFVISSAGGRITFYFGRLDNILLAPAHTLTRRHLHFYFQFIQRQMEK